jgi:hypothetical protein
LRAFLIGLPLQISGAVLLFVADRDVGWFLSHLVTAFGSSFLIALAAALISVAASSAPAEIGLPMRVFGWIGFGCGWCFSVLGGAIIGLHPVMLIYIIFFGGIGLVCGLAAGAAAGAVVAWGKTTHPQ